MDLKKIKKAVVFFLLPVFLISDGAAANPLLFLSPAAKGKIEILLPPSLGNLERIKYPSPGKPFIFCTQTVHGDYQGARQIAKIAGHLKEKYSADLVFAEGAAGKLNPEFLSFFPEAEKNRKLLRTLGEQGFLTGADLALKHVEAVGIENPEFYRQAFKLFKTVIRRKPENIKKITRYQKKMEDQLFKLGERELAGLLRLWFDEQEGKMDLATLTRILKDKARVILDLDFENLFTQFEWPHLVRLVLLNELEQMRDEKALFAQTQNLRKKLPGFDWNPKNVTRQKYVRLIKQMEASGLSPRHYPQIIYTNAALIFEKEINAVLLEREIETLFEKFFTTLGKPPEVSLILKNYKKLLAIKKLLSLELSRKEWKSFDRDAKKQWPEIRGSSEAALRFYELQEKRERIFFNRIQDELSRRKLKTAVLVSGGFHTEGMLRIFEENGFGYAVISPRLKEPISPELYHQRVLGRSHMELQPLADGAFFRLGDPDFYRAQLQALKTAAHGLGLPLSDSIPFIADRMAVLKVVDSGGKLAQTAHDRRSESRMTLKQKTDFWKSQRHWELLVEAFSVLVDNGSFDKTLLADYPEPIRQKIGEDWNSSEPDPPTVPLQEEDPFWPYNIGVSPKEVLFSETGSKPNYGMIGTAPREPADKIIHGKRIEKLTVALEEIQNEEWKILKEYNENALKPPLLLPGEIFMGAGVGTSFMTFDVKEQAGTFFYVDPLINVIYFTWDFLDDLDLAKESNRTLLKAQIRQARRDVLIQKALLSAPIEKYALWYTGVQRFMEKSKGIMSEEMLSYSGWLRHFLALDDAKRDKLAREMRDLSGEQGIIKKLEEEIGLAKFLDLDKIAAIPAIWADVVAYKAKAAELMQAYNRLVFLQERISWNEEGWKKRALETFHKQYALISLTIFVDDGMLPAHAQKDKVLAYLWEEKPDGDYRNFLMALEAFLGQPFGIFPEGIPEHVGYPRALRGRERTMLINLVEGFLSSFEKGYISILKSRQARARKENKAKFDDVIKEILRLFQTFKKRVDLRGRFLNAFENYGSPIIDGPEIYGIQKMHQGGHLRIQIMDKKRYELVNAAEAVDVFLNIPPALEITVPVDGGPVVLTRVLASSFHGSGPVFFIRQRTLKEKDWVNARVRNEFPETSFPGRAEEILDLLKYSPEESEIDGTPLLAAYPDILKAAKDFAQQNGFAFEDRTNLKPEWISAEKTRRLAALNSQIETAVLAALEDKEVLVRKISSEEGEVLEYRFKKQGLEYRVVRTSAGAYEFYIPQPPEKRKPPVRWVLTEKGLENGEGWLADLSQADQDIPRELFDLARDFFGKELFKRINDQKLLERKIRLDEIQALKRELGDFLNRIENYTRFDMETRNHDSEESPAAQVHADYHIQGAGWSYLVKAQFIKGEWKYELPLQGKEERGIVLSAQGVAGSQRPIAAEDQPVFQELYKRLHGWFEHAIHKLNQKIEETAFNTALHAEPILRQLEELLEQAEKGGGLSLTEDSRRSFEAGISREVRYKFVFEGQERIISETGSEFQFILPWQGPDEQSSSPTEFILSSKGLGGPFWTVELKQYQQRYIELYQRFLIVFGAEYRNRIRNRTEKLERDRAQDQLRKEKEQLTKIVALRERLGAAKLGKMEEILFSGNSEKQYEFSDSGQSVTVIQGEDYVLLQISGQEVRLMFAGSFELEYMEWLDFLESKLKSLKGGEGLRAELRELPGLSWFSFIEQSHSFQKAAPGFPELDGRLGLANLDWDETTTHKFFRALVGWTKEPGGQTSKWRLIDFSHFWTSHAPEEKVRVVRQYDEVPAISDPQIQVLANLLARNPLAEIYFQLPEKNPEFIRDFHDEVLRRRRELGSDSVKVSLHVLMKDEEAFGALAKAGISRAFYWGKKAHDFHVELLRENPDAQLFFVQSVEGELKADALTQVAALLAALINLYAPQAIQARVWTVQSLLEDHLSLAGQVRDLLLQSA